MALEDYFSMEPAAVLTEEGLRAAYKRLVETPPPPPCGTRERPHVVHPRATGWTQCANCFCAVNVANSVHR